MIDGGPRKTMNTAAMIEAMPVSTWLSKSCQNRHEV